MDTISASESCGIGETCFMDLSGNPTNLRNRIKDSRTTEEQRMTEGIKTTREKTELLQIQDSCVVLKVQLYFRME
jgi:hypothetical protein